MHLLNFFFLNSGSSCSTQSNFYFCPNWIFINSLLRSSFEVFSEISFTRIEISLSLMRMTPHTVSIDSCSTSILQHESQDRFCPPHPVLALGFRVRLSLLSFWKAGSPREICDPVFVVCGFWEIRDTVVVWIVDGRRVIICSDYLVGRLVLITCEVERLGQVVKLLVTNVGVRLPTPDEMSGTADQSRWPWGKSRDGADKEG